MPTYEYQCETCKHHFEVFQPITEEPLKRCPKCRKKVRRLIGKGAGILFKGSGFHETDYRSESYKKQMKEEKRKTDTSGKKKEKTKPKTSSSASGSEKTTATKKA